ncbi:UDP-galactopyranose mutase [Lachnospiraceae bacterium KH1T2]|nr:UDP-galactopyranose mutase [Lachnospiraceae bacterium KH1T2]
MYDYLIVGAGLYGAVFANKAIEAGKTCLVIDKRANIAGNIYTEKQHGINVHKYGAHIFHTDNKEVWDYVNSFAEFNRYTNSPVARYKDQLYNLPFNMNTFHELWGVVTPEEAKAEIARQTAEAAKSISEPKNLEEQALLLGGKDIYEKLIKGYTEKQWGRRATELPAFIIKRLPFRFIYDNNYFNDKYQGIPVGGYTDMIKNMLCGADVLTNTDFYEHKEELMKKASKVIFTGLIDEYFGYSLGELEYRSLRFETETMDTDSFQGNAVVNYTEYEIPYTRIIEHKFFEEFGSAPKNSEEGKTIVTREYPAEWKRGDEPYYPVNNEKNNALYEKYRELAEKEENVFFGGRLGKYRYYDMDDVIADALNDAKELIK